MHGSHSLGNLADRACVAPPMVSNHFLSGTDTPVLEAGSHAKDSHDPACGGNSSGGLEPCRCSRPVRDAAPTIAPTIFCSARLAADAGPGQRAHRRDLLRLVSGECPDLDVLALVDAAPRLPQIRPDALDAPDFVGIGANPARQDGQRGRRNGGGSPWVPCQLARPRPRWTT